MKKPVSLEEFGEMVHKITNFKVTSGKQVKKENNNKVKVRLPNKHKLDRKRNR